MAKTAEFESLTLSEKINLHEAEQPWKPTFKKNINIEDSSETFLVKENIEKKVLCILNKITPQKYNVLLVQLKMLDIDAKNKLDSVFNLIYARAGYEPLYCAVYAKLYKDIFFDKKVTLGLSEDIVEKEISFSQQMGHMRFIGELFKLRMISEQFIYNFIEHQFSLNDEQALASICYLLNSMGKELEGRDEKSLKKCEDYFQQMQELIDKHSTSTRIRFMLQDVIDLRKNNWIPRRAENCPKTIDQIHLEAAQEGKIFNAETISQKLPLNHQSDELNQLRLKSVHIMEEFLDHKDFEVTINVVTKLFSSSTINIFLKSAISKVLELFSKDRNLAGQLLTRLVKEKVISMEQYTDSITYVLKNEMDVQPSTSTISDNFAEILLPLMKDDTYKLDILKDLLKPCIPSRTAGELVAKILHDLSKEKGHVTVQQMWKQCKLKFADFLGEKFSANEFICAHKLEFVVDDSKSSSENR